MNELHKANFRMGDLSRENTTVQKFAPVADHPLIRTKKGLLAKLSVACRRQMMQIVGKTRHRLPQIPVSPRQRFVAANAILLILLGLIIQIAQPFMSAQAYALSPTAKKLIGDSRDDTKQYLKLSQDGASYDFSVPDKTSATTDKHGGRNDSVYSTSLQTDAKKGITYTDTATKISITVTPKFDMSPGKKIPGDSVVYPSGADQVVYTHKYNGLKEDIIVPSPGGDSLNYNFELTLPSGVEARLDAQGNIGIFSADTSLYGNISFGSDKDRARVDLARQNAKKTNLVATIPSPIIKDAKGKEYDNKASFTLSAKTTKQTKEAPKGVPAEVAAKMASQTTTNTYQLGITTHNIQTLSYPISVDPTIQAISASDFMQGNNVNNIDVDTTNNLIKRGALTGGSVGAFTATTSFTTARDHFVGVSYNGYLYVVGGDSGSKQADVQYAKFGSAGALSTNAGCGTAWCATTSLPTGRSDDNGFVYGGYLYVLGGNDGTTAYTTAVLYAKINSNGSIGNWQSTTSFSTARQDFGLVVYAGYVYILGGYNGTNMTSVEYAPLHGDGTVGTWSSGTALPQGRSWLPAVAYNGNIYILGGYSGGYLNTVYYAPLNTNGTIGTWIITSAFTTARNDLAALVANGYMYILGGNNGSQLNDVQYARINTDGSLDTWAATNSFATIRHNHSTVVNNGYAYVMGGSNSGKLSDVQFAKINPAGVNTAFSSGNSITTAVSFAGNVASNGYIYSIGGCTTASSTATTCSNISNVVNSGAVAADGTITWSTASAVLPVARYSVSAAVYNGYIYITGGCALATCAYLATTYYGQITSNGTVASWATATASYTNARIAPMVAYNGYLYLLGGKNGSTQTQADSGVLASTGDISSWSTQTSLGGHDMSATNVWQPAVVIGDKVYAGLDNSTLEYATLTAGVIGAWTSSSVFGASPATGSFVYDRGYLYWLSGAGIKHVQVNSNGSLDTTVVTDNTSATARGFFGAFPVNGYLFNVAGCTNITNYTTAACGSRTNTTEKSTVNNGGSGLLNTWATTTALADPDGIGSKTAARLIGDGVIAVNSCIYVLGGVKSVGGVVSYNDVQSAAIAGDGTVGSWGATTSLPAAIGRPTVTTYNGYVYVYDNGGTSIYYAQLGASCSVGAWGSSGTLNTARGGTRIEASNGYLYIVGGYQPSDLTISIATTEYSQINSNGTLAGWTNGTSLNDSHRDGVTVVYGGYLYAISGCMDQGGTICTQTNDSPTSVEYASIASGAPSAWTRTTALIRGGIVSNAYALNGYLYFIGGRNDTTGIDTTAVGFYAPFLAGGGVGNWQKTVTRSTGNYWAAYAVYNDYLYMVGGVSSGTESSVVNYTSALSISRTGSYSRLIDFDKGVSPSKLVTRGTKLDSGTVNLDYQTVNNASATFTNSQSLSNIGYNAASASAFSLGTNVTLSRYLFMTYTIDDSLSATFPDSVGGQSSITDYDLYFVPNAGLRLRGGQTFTTQKDRGLQANPL